MSRIEEKVKDLIEVRRHEQLLDFLAEPEKTVSSYYYTPVTAELMVSWLDAVSAVEKDRGACKALAGYRGVGKSHFLATFGAMLAHPEMRAKVDDSHVFSSLHHLKRRHYPVAYVRRGTKPTFTEELVNAVCLSMGIPFEEAPSNIEALITLAASSAKEMPFVIIVDTDLERSSRVARDDGALLGELARISRGKNIFIGVALDDDITDADGINAAIADSFTIDYLDQEHLYQIVNTYVFPKHRHSAHLIQGLYREFRNTLPNFRWSEQRFNSLYPLHPSILEVAPFVRFYAPTFGLLGFAAKAGERILGRPANSLISLDEVFDNVEATLRKSPDLKESFTAYDSASAEVIAKLPVMQRLQAKLILKALFILSLDGDGTTAGEISEAMLIFDENDPQHSISATTELLTSFASNIEGVWEKAEEGRETRFGIKIASKDDLNSALDQAIASVTDAEVSRTLLRVAKDKFSDWVLDPNNLAARASEFTAEFVWRGSKRKADIVWEWGNNLPAANKPREKQQKVDLHISIVAPTFAATEGNPADSGIKWISGTLTKDEIETLKRLSVLLSDSTLKKKFGEQVRAAGHTNIVAAEKIWERIFFKAAKLQISSEIHPIPENIRTHGLFGEVLEDMFDGYFEKNYPSHPQFNGTLDMEKVGLLVNDLFSGVRGVTPNVQEVAQKFAFPLGLVHVQDGNLTLVNEKQLVSTPFLKPFVEKVENLGEGVLSLQQVDSDLGASPYGLSPEAQYLVLSALVALRNIEFVTSRGDRISHRSLDLKILWDDIIGIARPEDVTADYEKLNQWARALLRNNEIPEFKESEGRVEVVSALSEWRNRWLESGILERFAEVPDEGLNRRIWNLSVTIEKSFGVVARILNHIGEDSSVLEDVLQRIAETFSNSFSELDERYKDLMRFKRFIEGFGRRRQVWSYLAVSEITHDEEIEKYRQRLLALIDQGNNYSANYSSDEFESTWNAFHEKFTEHFTIRHDAIMNSQQMKREFEAILKSDEWWEFEYLSKLAIFKPIHWRRAQKILKRYRELECSFDAKANLNTHPFCACSFSLSRISELATLAKSLETTIRAARRSYRNTLRTLKEFIEQRIQQLVAAEPKNGMQQAAKELLTHLNSPNLAPFTGDQLVVLYNAMLNDSTSTTVSIAFPGQGNLYTSEELRSRVNAWIDDLPDYPIMLKL
ncbi:MAG: hypothetical protein ACK5NT_14870 [Pyrinomonadaceae bacterium]